MAKGKGRGANSPMTGKSAGGLYGDEAMEGAMDGDFSDNPSRNYASVVIPGKSHATKKTGRSGTASNFETPGKGSKGFRSDR